MFSQIQSMEKSSQINIIDLDKEIRPVQKNWSVSKI